MLVEYVTGMRTLSHDYGAKWNAWSIEIPNFILGIFCNYLVVNYSIERRPLPQKKKKILYLFSLHKYPEGMTTKSISMALY